ncbi:HBR273Wp [Eremothecium sinecaudum]|uniref:HBR273Wp n=1 Tax=Eremothecium sinecaudum TaxID=45286 RepID=A0A120K198_9SACH|nr:HBR273Wp [Eremothecium sinecaudum]AMD19174.1 HBR273Wp [Eremothecium sinecaudum]
MFDPLDFISSVSNSHTHTVDDGVICVQHKLQTKQAGLLSDSNASNGPRLNVPPTPPESDMSPISVLDLPSPNLADPNVIYGVLQLLQPDTQVNFSNEQQDGNNDWKYVISEKNMSETTLYAIMNYYNKFNNKVIFNFQTLCTKVPMLLSQFGPELIGYYNNILRYYESSNAPLKNEIIEQASLRISEQCGRTALPALTRKFHVDGLSHEIKLHEPALTNDNLGLKTWGASLILSQKILQIHSRTKVLELGAGTGLVGISYALSHSESNSQIILTDLPEIVPNLKKNIRLNGLQNVHATVLDWTNPKSFLDEFGEEKFDTILIADPIYSPKHPYWLVAMIKKFLASDGIVYLEVPIRAKYKAERELLWNLLDLNNLKVLKEEYDDGYDDWGKVQYLFKEISFAD